MNYTQSPEGKIKGSLQLIVTKNTLRRLTIWKSELRLGNRIVQRGKNCRLNKLKNERDVFIGEYENRNTVSL